MRSFRKLTAAVMTVVMVLASMTVAFAADSAALANADKAVTLKDLGLYAGTDATDVAAGLDGALTTQDSLIFLAKLFGYNDAATKLTADQVTEALAKFDDAASISEYAKNVIAYSATNNILSGSTKDGKFFVGAKDTVTAARFATFMLRQMGYTVPDFRESVAQLAETKGSKIDATIAGDLTRDAAVGIMYGALTAEKASGKTVIADIVSDNASLKARAEKLGLIEQSSTRRESSGGSEELRVVSVNALNNKQLEIKFNLMMDKSSAQNESYYTIKDKGIDEKTLSYDSCKLGDDMKTVIITLDNEVIDCLTNASTAKVIVSKDIMAANGKKLNADEEVEIKVMDGILPTVKEVKAIGEKNIKITFSEPVYEGNNNSKILYSSLFAVKSGTYTYYVQKAELNLDVINLDIGTRLIEGPVNVTVNDAGLQGNAIQDYAGYKVFKGEHTFNYVKDIVSVYIKEAQLVEKNEIRIEFNTNMASVIGSDIELTNLTTPGSIKVSKCELIDIDSDGKTEGAVLTLDNDISTDVRNDAGELIGITTVANPSSVSELGYKLEPNSSITLKDKTPPEVVKWDHDYDESTSDVPKVVVDLGTTGIIRLYFSEVISESNLGEGTFEVSGYTITGITASEPKTVELAVSANTENIPDNTTVTQFSEIYDEAGNALIPGSEWEIILYIPTY